MPQVIKDSHENDDIEFLAQLGDVIDGHLPEFNVHIVDLRRESCLGQVIFVEINGHDALGPTPLHLERIKSSIAADIKDGFAG